MPGNQAAAAAGPRQRLTAPERSKFLSEGYCVIPFLSPPRLRAVRAAIEARVAYEGSAGGWEGGHSGVARRLCNLFSKGDVFVDMAVESVMLEAAALSIGRGRDFIFNAMNFHDPVPGQVARQPIHADRAFFPRCRGYFNAIIVLDAMTRDSGATRLVPRSHLQPWPNLEPRNLSAAGDHLTAEKPLADPLAAAPGEIFAEVDAGTAVLCHGDLWHGACDNRSTGTRRVIHLGFACTDTRPQYEIAATLPDMTRERLQPLIETLAPRRNWWRVDYSSS